MSRSWSRRASGSTTSTRSTSASIWGRGTAVSATSARVTSSCRSTPKKPIPGGLARSEARDPGHLGRLALAGILPYTYRLHERNRRSSALPPGTHHVCVWRGPRHVLHPRRLRHRHLLELPPVLHGQAEAARHRRPHRSLQQEVREGPDAEGVTA